jgi:signal transduction histidine kinase
MPVKETGKKAIHYNSNMGQNSCSLFAAFCQYLLLLHFFCLTITVFAQSPVVLTDSIEKLEISSKLSIFVDTTSMLLIDSIMRPEFRERFVPYSRMVPNFGFSRSACWFYVKLIDSSSSNRHWVLDIAMPSLHHVDFFVLHGECVILKGLSGFLADKDQRLTPYRNPSIELAKTEGKSISLFCRINSETPVILPVFIREKKRYITYHSSRELFLGFYFGALFILCFGFGQITAVYGFLSDWGILDLAEKTRWLHVVNFLAAFFGCLLTRAMINSRESSPRIDTAIRIAAGLLLLLAAWSPCMSFMMAERFILLANFIPLPLFVVASVQSWRKGHRPALYYLIATSSFIAGLLIYNMMYGLNLFPFNEFIYFIPNISFLVTLTLFSVGLSEQINQIKKEREAAREQILDDLKENLRLQKEKSAVERELEHSRKMETVGRLLSGVAHDMKNLLVPVQGYARILLKECRKDDRLHEKAEHLVNATGRLQNLAATLLDVSRKKTTGLRTIDLNETIGRLCSLLKHSAKIGVSIKTDLSTSTPCINGDEVMIYGALLNIGINAIDSINGSGVVTIETGISRMPPDVPTIADINSGPDIFAFVTVSDNGIGMDEETRSHLFEPFFTTKSDKKGTGLGLIGVYNCMKAHNGGIDVKTGLGQGCRITLYFPMTAAPDFQS